MDFSSHCSNPLLLKGFWKDILFHLLFTFTFPLFPLQVFYLPSMLCLFCWNSCRKTTIISLCFVCYILLHHPFENSSCLHPFPVPCAQCRCFVLLGFSSSRKILSDWSNPIRLSQLTYSGLSHHPFQACNCHTFTYLLNSY